jgi:hypothetical protein
MLTDVRVDGDGIVRNTAPEEITEEEAKSAIREMTGLLSGIPFEKRRVLVDFRKTRRGSPGARKVYLEATKAGLIPKGAVLVSTTYQKVLVSLVFKGGGRGT